MQKYIQARKRLGTALAAIAVAPAFLLGAVAADFQLAPAPPLVLGRVEEQPAAMVSRAALDARQVGAGEHAQDRKHDRTHDGLDRAHARVPDPGEGRGGRDQVRRRAMTIFAGWAKARSAAPTSDSQT